MLSEELFAIDGPEAFARAALETFRNQYRRIPVYRDFCDLLGRPPGQVSRLEQIPFLPIEFFKSHKVLDPALEPEAVFTSSGTTGMALSRHYIADLSLYRQSFKTAFELFYGPASRYCILALLPSYQERPGSSLIYMVDHLIRESGDPRSGFLGGPPERVAEQVRACDTGDRPVILIGVSFALLDLVQVAPMRLANTLVMETGGMKGRRVELVREALHQELREGFGLAEIHSEYGMTELLSQAYSRGCGLFHTPPWMRVMLRDTEDPLSYLGHQRTGGINIIDLANRDSCAFLATQDLGKSHADGTFEVLGRFDHSDVRGCNLMAL